MPDWDVQECTTGMCMGGMCGQDWSVPEYVSGNVHDCVHDQYVHDLHVHNQCVCVCVHD